MQTTHGARAGWKDGDSYSSAPRVPDAHLFHAGMRSMLLSVPRGRIHSIPQALADNLNRSMEFADAERVNLVLAAVGLADTVSPEPPPQSVVMRSLSLAVAQKCNLGCSYCYAQQGGFGQPEQSMSLDVAQTAIDRLFDAPQGDLITVAFLGGEPLTNRQVLRAATDYAAQRAADAGRKVAFAITTNATLIGEEDARFFNRHRFSVTVSLDGTRDVHDRLRQFKSGQGSYDRVVERSRLMLDLPDRLCRVRARVSVTPKNLRLSQTLEEFVALGFDDVLFSPVLSSPSGSDEMNPHDLDRLLEEMIACGRLFERALADGRIYPCSNVINTLRRIHDYKRDAYPCSAGGGYFGVSAQGQLYTCHRSVGEDPHAMGDVHAGVDPVRQQHWLAERNVHLQEPCRACWARYLCSGGCHYEAIRVGRPACDYIRGWLHYCLTLYAGLLLDNPSMLRRIIDAH